MALFVDHEIRERSRIDGAVSAATSSSRGDRHESVLVPRIALDLQLADSGTSLDRWDSIDRQRPSRLRVAGGWIRQAPEATAPAVSIASGALARRSSLGGLGLASRSSRWSSGV